jgi:predicted double-glycine peptidase
MAIASTLFSASLACFNSAGIGDSAALAAPSTCVRPWASIVSSKVVRQSLDQSCGAAAIATLARLLGLGNLTEEEVLGAAGKNDAMSVTELIAAGNKVGVALEAFAASRAALEKVELPVIVLIAPKNGDLSHFVVLTEIATDYVVYADPRLGNLVVRFDEFMDRWVVRKDETRPGIIVAHQTKNRLRSKTVETLPTLPFVLPGQAAY